MKLKYTLLLIFISFFLSCGNDLSRDKETLNEAIVNNDIEKIESLLEKERYRKIINDLPSTTVTMSASNEKIFTLLLGNGLDPNFAVANNEPLLEWAIKNDPRIADLLVHQGANLNLKEEQLVFTALDNMSDYFLGELFREAPGLLLVKNQWNIPVYGAMLGKKRYTALMQLKNNRKAFDILLSQEDIFLRIITGFSEDKENKEFADMLVANGFNLNNGYPYLQCAIWDLNIDGFKWLLDNGCSPLDESTIYGVPFGTDNPLNVVIMRERLVGNPKKIASDVPEHPPQQNEELEKEREILRKMRLMLMEKIEEMET